MKRDILLNKLEELKQEHKKVARVTNDPVVEIETLLEEYLREHPKDTELWFQLALATFILHDELKTMGCLEKILAYEPDNAYAMIILAYISYTVSGMSEDQSVVQRLFAFQTDDPRLMSMIEHLKGRYFFAESLSDTRYQGLQEAALKKSIALCDQYVWNHVKLANFYTDHNRIKEARRLLICALSNIKRVCSEKCHYDFLSVERFINEYITGIWINTIQYNHILALLTNFTLQGI